MQIAPVYERPIVIIEAGPDIAPATPAAMVASVAGKPPAETLAELSAATNALSRYRWASLRTRWTTR